MTIRVLVVDDSATVRRAMVDGLGRYPDVEVVGTAADPYAAREKIAALRPDVLILDIEMPRMDGLTFLEKLMQHHPMPVIVVSAVAAEGSANALRALTLGAVDVVPKPGSTYSAPNVDQVLIRAIRAAASARLPDPVLPATLEPTSAPGPSGSGIVAIGASTGGTRAIEAVLTNLSADGPAMLVVQHMPEFFTGPFAERLDGLSAMDVREARDGDEPRPGLALIAPGGRHMLLRRFGERLVVRLKNGPPVHHQRPSVDVLFNSVAEVAGPRAVGVLLTGMGSDGARGLLAMRRRGAHTIAESEETAVVFGMPREAIMLGAAAEVVPLPRVAGALLVALSRIGDEPSDAARGG